MTEQVTITIRSEGKNPIPMEIRLRRFLKLALRCFGLRCIDIAEAKQPETPVKTY